MTIQQQIKDNMKQAMLQKNTEVRDILRVVLGEFSRVGKEVSDDQALPILKKMGQNASDQNNLDELHIIAEYLPTQMDEDELTEKIQNCITFNSYTTMQDMGKVMGYMKKNHDGTYDGKLASTIVKKLLS